jgi:amino acid transporter
LLEFIALAVLRSRKPRMARPFRIPGGPVMAWMLGAPSAVLLGYATWASRGETIGGHPALVWCAGIMAAGICVFFVAKSFRAKSSLRG